MQTIDIDTLAAHTEALRTDQRALRKRYGAHAPEEAVVVDTASSVARAGQSPMWGSVQVGGADFGVKVPVGVHRAVGGRHDLPVPGDILCAALAACVDSTIRIISNNVGIPLESLEVDVRAECDVRGTLLVDPSVRVGFNTMRVRVKALPGPEVSREQVEGLVKTAERCCVVLQTLSKGVDVDFQLGAGEAAESETPPEGRAETRPGCERVSARDSSSQDPQRISRSPAVVLLDTPADPAFPPTDDLHNRLPSQEKAS